MWNDGRGIHARTPVSAAAIGIARCFAAEVALSGPEARRLVAVAADPTVEAAVGLIVSASELCLGDGKVSLVEVPFWNDALNEDSVERLELQRATRNGRRSRTRTGA